MQIDHIAIWNKDIEAIKDFYVQYFSCSFNKKYHNPKTNFTSYFLTFSNGFRLEIMHKPEINDRCTNEQLGLCHIAIGVGSNEKVDSLTAKLEFDGYRVIGNPRFTGDGYYESVILDPEGNSVELVAFVDMEIEEAEESDLHTILYLQKCCYLSEAEIINNYNIPPIKQSYSDILEEFQEQVILKLIYKSKIIGSVRAYEKEGTCFIGKLIVDPEYQGKGFGKMLMQNIEQRFEKVKRFELFTGSKSKNNIALYNKLGYSLFKEVEYDGVGFVYLQKLAIK